MSGAARGWAIVAVLLGWCALAGVLDGVAAWEGSPPRAIAEVAASGGAALAMAAIAAAAWARRARTPRRGRAGDEV